MLSPLEIRARGLNDKQSKHLEALIGRFTNRTRQSKELAAQYRGVLADSRAAVGFRFTTKEMLYPIVGKLDLFNFPTTICGALNYDAPSFLENF